MDHQGKVFCRDGLSGRRNVAKTAKFMSAVEYYLGLYLNPPDFNIVVAWLLTKDFVSSLFFICLSCITCFTSCWTDPILLTWPRAAWIAFFQTSERSGTRADGIWSGVEVPPHVNDIQDAGGVHGVFNLSFWPLHRLMADHHFISFPFHSIPLAEERGPKTSEGRTQVPLAGNHVSRRRIVSCYAVFYSSSYSRLINHFYSFLWHEGSRFHRRAECCAG